MSDDEIEVTQESKRQYINTFYRIHNKFKAGIISEEEKSQMLDQAMQLRNRNAVSEMSHISKIPSLGLYNGTDRRVYHKQYYNLKRDVLLERISQKETCNCGKTYSLGHKSRHLKTKYHNVHSK